MGYDHSITLPGIFSSNIHKRVVNVVDGDKEVELTLGKTDTLITFTANNKDISYTFTDYDINGNVVGGGELVEIEPPAPPEPVLVPEIAPEAPTNVLPPVPPEVIEGNVVLTPASDV